jgi:hypothetical protein
MLKWNLKMKTNPVRHKLKRGEASFGTWLTLPDLFSAQLMSKMGFDWLTVEMEHAPMTIEMTAAMCATVANAGVVPLTRIPINNVENIKRVLDTGAWGIVVPMVNSRAEAEAVVEAARYRPIGRRSIGGWRQTPGTGGNRISFVGDTTGFAGVYYRRYDVVLVTPQGQRLPGVYGTQTRFWIGPGWMLLVSGGSAALCWRLWLKRRRRERGASQLCRNCGYDLRATPERCPECGVEVAVAGMTNEGMNQ